HAHAARLGACHPVRQRAVVHLPDLERVVVNKVLRWLGLRKQSDLCDWCATTSIEEIAVAFALWRAMRDLGFAEEVPDIVDIQANRQTLNSFTLTVLEAYERQKNAYERMLLR